MREDHLFYTTGNAPSQGKHTPEYMSAPQAKLASNYRKNIHLRKAT